jgi:hypothetical protein
MMNGSAMLRFSTEGLPERERVPFSREQFGRNIIRLEIEPLLDAPSN